MERDVRSPIKKPLLAVCECHTHTKKLVLDFGTAHQLKTSSKEVITNALRDAPLKMSFTSF